MSEQQDIPEDDALAAEYVLRLLDADAEQAFETRLLHEPVLRAQVHFWEAQLADLADDLPEETPPARVRAKILSGLNAPAATPNRKWSLNWLAFPGIAAAATAAFFVISPMVVGPSFDPTLHATLVSADGSLHIEAGYAPDGNLFKVIPESGAPSSGRDFELWVIGANAEGPVSLGVIPSDQETLFEITPEIAALIDGGILAVSDEPAGGSPTGSPTGAILATDAFFDAKLFQAG